MIDRQTITECPLCGSTNIEHIIGEHTNPLRGKAQNVPQIVCHDCGEIFLGPDSLEVMRSQDIQIMEGKSDGYESSLLEYS